VASKTRFWNAVLVLLSAGNLVSVWFAARPGEPWHATIHAALALAFGLWAQGRMWLEEARLRAGALDKGSEVETAALRDEVGEVRRELGEVQERLDFTERLLSQKREVDRLPGRRET
jgi:transposase-like protein